MLDIKWFRPIIESINTMPIDFINNLVSDINKLSSKYNTTYENIEKEIEETQKNFELKVGAKRHEPKVKK